MRKQYPIPFVFAVLILMVLLPLAVQAAGNTAKNAAEHPWKGLVVEISDGNTILVMRNGRPENIRLYGIDCPEMGQAFGKRARQFTSDQVYRKTVMVVPRKKDQYGRTAAMVYPLNVAESLNAAIVQAGYAWVYREDCTAEYCPLWLEMEQIAKEKGLGLWADGNPIPPWEFKKNTP